MSILLAVLFTLVFSCGYAAAEEVQPVQVDSYTVDPERLKAAEVEDRRILKEQQKAERDYWLTCPTQKAAPVPRSSGKVGRAVSRFFQGVGNAAKRQHGYMVAPAGPGFTVQQLY